MYGVGDVRNTNILSSLLYKTILLWFSWFLEDYIIYSGIINKVC